MIKRLRVAAALAAALVATSAFAGPDYSPSKRGQYPSPNLNRADVDTLVVRGQNSTGEIPKMTVGGAPLSGLLSAAPQIVDGRLQFLNGPTLGTIGPGGTFTLTPDAVTAPSLTLTGPGLSGPIDSGTVGGTAIPAILGTKAPLASPTFSGTVTAPALSVSGATSVGSLSTSGAVTAGSLTGDGAAVTVGGTALPSVLGTKAPLASPTFTGAVTAPSLSLTGPGLSGPVDGATALAPGAAASRILQDWLGSTHFNVSTVSALRAWPVAPLIAGAAVRTSGYYAAADGGGGEYVWSATSAAPDDGCLTIRPTSVTGAGRWLAQLPGGSDLSVLRCGVRADYDFGSATGTDNTASLQAAINVARSIQAQGQGLRLTLPPTPILTGPLTIPGQVDIAGAGSHASTLVLRSDATAAAITVQTGGGYAGGGYPPANVSLRHFRITGQAGRGGGAAGHGLSVVAGAVGAWVRADDMMFYNLPGSGVTGSNFNGFVEFTRSAFRSNGKYGSDTNGTVDWRYIDCDWGENIAGNIRSSGDSQHVLLNPNVYSSSGHGIVAFRTDLKIIGGLIDRNAKNGISFEGDPAGIGRVVLTGGATLGENSAGNPGVYHDIAVYGSGTGLFLGGARFTTKPRVQDGNSSILNNIYYDIAATASVVDMGTQYAGGTLFSTGVSNAPTKIGSNPLGAYETYAPTMTAAADPGPSTFVAGAASGRFQLVGKRLHLSLKGTVGQTGNGVYFVAFTLPASMLPAADGVISGFSSNGRLLSGQVIAGQSAIYFRYADGTYPGINGATITATGSVEIQ